MPIKDCELELNKNQRQTNHQGTPMFPCAAYYTDVTHNLSGELTWHWHEEVEILIVDKGTAQLNLYGNNFTLKEGEGAFINANAMHSIRSIEDNNCILHSLLFHSTLISGSPESIFEHRYVRPLLNAPHLSFIIFQKYSPILQFFTDAYDAYEKEDFGYELVVREKLSKIWLLIVQNMEPELKQKSDENLDSARIKDMLNYLHLNYSYPITLLDIAAAANISERECQRCFQKIIGISPMKYLLKYRISTAARLLIETDDHITAICHKTGFDNPSYFSKKFKYYLDDTPTEYRKKSQP